MRRGQQNLSKRGVNIVESGVNHVIIHAPDRLVAATQSAAEVQRTEQAETPGVAGPKLYGHRTRANIQPGITYLELRRFLARHGFEQINATGAHKAFKEHVSGALVILPDYQDTDEIRPFHLASVRKLLAEHGFMKQT